MAFPKYSKSFTTVITQSNEIFLKKNNLYGWIKVRIRIHLLQRKRIPCVPKRKDDPSKTMGEKKKKKRVKRTKTWVGGGWKSKLRGLLTNYLSSKTSQAGQASIGLLEAGAKRQSWQQPQQGGGWWRRNRARLRSSSCSQYIFFRSCLSAMRKTKKQKTKKIERISRQGLRPNRMHPSFKP